MAQATQAPSKAAETKQPEVPSTEKWEKEIAAIEAKSSKLKPEERRWIFTGSSSIRLWKLNEAFPDVPIANHGFGGSQMIDVDRNFHRLIGRWKPQGVVIYSGDNDLARRSRPRKSSPTCEASSISCRASYPTPN
ncbi:MAG: hypothetical protein QM811_14155 [Pirellulales bacterium]